MIHDEGVERIINAFESGWLAGASLGGTQLAQFKSLGSDLQVFWLDGYYAAQEHIGTSGSVVAEAKEARSASKEWADPSAAEHRLSHPITRALHAAYQAAGGPPSQDKLTAMLAKLDMIS